MDVAIEPSISTEQVRIWAGLQGFISLAAVVALALFFLLSGSSASGPSRWAWLGPVNDWLAVIGAAPWVVAMVLLATYVRAGPWLWVLTVVACAGATAIAIVTLLMLAGRVGLQAQSVVSVGAALVAFAWIAFAGSAAHAAGAVPAWVSVLAIAIVVAFVAGGIVAGLGYVSPAGSALQTTLYIVGGSLVGLSWFAFPAWWLILAPTLA